MDFGAILEKWEKQNAKTQNEIYDRDSAPRKFDVMKVGERRSRLLRKSPDDHIDLHGLNRDEAWIALENFFENSRRKGHEKILIIHGKGNHGASVQGEAALKELSRRFIETCSFAGESWHGSAKDGGTGATWVILKENGSYRSR